ncbi:MAG: transcriptional repressor NrdR [Nitrospinae bacterium]|nr:transcriptional repressor NrdR [Nitrospinota bacterium]
MRCPYCGNMENKVIDSRLSKEGDMIRRRRECLHCANRFTTYERIEINLPPVIKKDGRREPFNREKILIGVQKACQKRPISIEIQEELVNKVIKFCQESGEKGIPCKIIGERVVKELYKLDDVAYMRFVSVYHSFKDINEFMNELTILLKDKKAYKEA